MWREIVLLAVCAAAFGQTPHLDALRALLVPQREHPREHMETRGATSNFTVIKHHLRDWIESRLTPLKGKDEDVVLAFQLNTELRKMGLACSESPAPDEIKCPDWSLVGFLDQIAIHRSGEFLIVQTAIGIYCGADESAYIYQWKEKRWQRIWQNEQNDYTNKNYLPQRLRAVAISPTDYNGQGARPEHFVVTLGKFPWCTSNWQPIYYRIWRTNTVDQRSKLLLDGNEIGFISEPIVASAWPDDVLIEYAVGSVDVGVHNRRQVRHYVMEGDTIKRVDPFVLGPRDFVDHWLQGPSDEILRRTQANVRISVEDWRRRFNGPFEFIQRTHHCTQISDRWQVGVGNAKTERPLGYFLVQWRPPYHFSMVGISDHSWPNCVKEDPEADQFRTMFPDLDRH